MIVGNSLVLEGLEKIDLVRMGNVFISQSELGQSRILGGCSLGMIADRKREINITGNASILFSAVVLSVLFLLYGLFPTFGYVSLFHWAISLLATLLPFILVTISLVKRTRRVRSGPFKRYMIAFLPYIFVYGILVLFIPVSVILQDSLFMTQLLLFFL